MNQSRLESLIETLINTAIGFAVSYAAWPLVAVMFDMHYSAALILTPPCHTEASQLQTVRATRRWEIAWQYL
jgi:hypothetical protein